MGMFNGRDEEFMFPKPETIDSDVAREDQIDYATDAFLPVTPLWQCIAVYAALFLLAAVAGWGGYKVLDWMGG
jgi:hypothetical protein